MMRRLRLIGVMIFIIAIIVFVLHKGNDLLNRDKTGPVITMDQKSITVSCAATNEELLAGVVATDEKDGDVSDSMIVEGMSNFIEDGRRNITIAAFDSDNHVTKISREVIYSDYTSPRFNLAGPLKFSRNSESILVGISAEDVLDGNLTSKIKISSDYSVQVDTEGEYPVVYTVANSAGDMVGLPVTVQIYDVQEENRRANIELSQYIVYTKAGTAVNPWNYVNKVTLSANVYERDAEGVLRLSGENNGTIPDSFTEAQFKITGDADYNTPGVYEILYQLDTEYSEPGNVRLIVVVE